MHKKDESGHFYMDYRALNATMMKDRYPIPIIGELLDELQGAVVLSKFDPRAG